MGERTREERRSRGIEGEMLRHHSGVVEGVGASGGVARGAVPVSTGGRRLGEEDDRWAPPVIGEKSVREGTGSGVSSWAVGLKRYWAGLAASVHFPLLFFFLLSFILFCLPFCFVTFA
jgi:hypothetical protein